MNVLRVRQFTSGKVHYARHEGLMLYDAAVFGHPVTAIQPPVATLCRSVLKGDCIRIPDLPDRGYAVTCKACLAVSEASR